MKFPIFVFAFVLLFQTKAYADDYDILFGDVLAEEVTVTKPVSGNAISNLDPYSDFNRAMFDFNLAFHDSIGRPLSNAYKKIPSPARTGLENFIDNLGEPLSMLNSFLQGDIEGGLTGFMRFAFNSTIGFFGVLDIATEMGLHSKNEDLGQTLFVWGVWPETNYLVLPLLGPTTTRGIFGSGVESISDPFEIYDHADFGDEQRIALFATSGFISYTKVAPLLDDLINRSTGYEFAREGYIQLRMGQLYNGAPPMPALDDFNFD
ncbi:VacJ family lipoprotein [Thiomicrorhabdus sp. 6S2-11]|uniref:VacJ family lipoprotein n=1 Tax=Thiomicrorhabdus marina TaxID=2818442 RepID=A0ABS3Q5F5_9GAMM|nr:VacJ family lipoprotein [Thiomicrorhabdus marina]MBO1927393.1 VacJ family lipoprotein [Thiomicrorhabdus marina]